MFQPSSIFCDQERMLTGWLKCWKLMSSNSQASLWVFGFDFFFFLGTIGKNEQYHWERVGCMSSQIVMCLSFLSFSIAQFHIFFPPFKWGHWPPAFTLLTFQPPDMHPCIIVPLYFLVLFPTYPVPSCIHLAKSDVHCLALLLFLQQLLPMAFLEQALWKEQPGEGLKELYDSHKWWKNWKDHLKLFTTRILRKNTAFIKFDYVPKCSKLG